MASNLPAVEAAAQMLADALAAGEPLPEGAAEGQPMPADGQPTGEGPPMPAESGQPGEGQSQPGQPGQGKPAANPGQLGTGFVPQSPKVTAQMIAGEKAQQAMQQALSQAQLPLAQQTPNGLPAQPGQPQPSESQEGQPQPGQPSNSSKLAKKDGAPATNQKVKDGKIEKQPEGTDVSDSKSAKAREPEEGVLARQLKDEPWFAKLPPELRKSIRAGAGQKPPRAYEERLRKYFESVD